MSSWSLVAGFALVVFAVGAWVMLGKIGKGAEWALVRCLRRWGAERHAAAVVGAVSSSLLVVVLLWLGWAWWALVLLFAVVLIAQKVAKSNGQIEASSGGAAWAVGALLIGFALSWMVTGGIGDTGGKPDARNDGAALVKVSPVGGDGTITGGAVANAEGAAAVGHAPITEKAACLCSAGASCVGPRGGVYCLTDAGAKRYLPKQ